MLLFGFVITPYKLDLVESIIFIVLFVSYIILLIVRAKKSKQEVEEVQEEGLTLKTLIAGVVLGIVGLFAILGEIAIASIICAVFVIISKID